MSPRNQRSFREGQPLRNGSGSVLQDLDTRAHPSPDITDQTNDDVDEDASYALEHVAWNESGDIEVRGPTNTLYESERCGLPRQHGNSNQIMSAMLTANAALERQKEAGYREILLARGDIEGVPAELALHLLDIHWSRHHFFLLTYRPVFYRDMICKGRYYSQLLFYAIMAVTSRYSEREEVGGGNHSSISGDAFYKRAEGLLLDAMGKSSIPTAVALLLMGNALVSGGQIDRGWLYTGTRLSFDAVMLETTLNESAAPTYVKKKDC